MHTRLTLALLLKSSPAFLVFCVISLGSMDDRGDLVFQSFQRGFNRIRSIALALPFEEFPSSWLFEAFGGFYTVDFVF